VAARRRCPPAPAPARTCSPRRSSSRIALTKGIYFLYSQAAEVLKRRRERKKTAEGGSLLVAADGLRRALEAVYQQRITFKGEPEREASGPVLIGRIDVQEVASYVAGVRARRVEGGARLEGEIKAGRVERDAEAVAVDADTVTG
jgi:hypothetical protein